MKNFDFKKLIPEKFLTEQRIVDFLDVLTEIFVELGTSIDDTTNLISVDVQDDYIEYLMNTLGWDYDPNITLQDNKFFIRELKGIYDIKSAKLFFYNLGKIYNVSIAFRDTYDDVIKTSAGTGLSENYVFQDGRTVRDGVLNVTLTINDRDRIKDIIERYIPAGWIITYDLYLSTGIESVIKSQSIEFEENPGIDFVSVVKILTEVHSSLYFETESLLKVTPTQLGEQIITESGYNNQVYGNIIYGD